MINSSSNRKKWQLPTKRREKEIKNNNSKENAEHRQTHSHRNAHVMFTCIYCTRTYAVIAAFDGKSYQFGC